MPRSSAQADFAVSRAAESPLPLAAQIVALPEASRFASAFATRWIMRITVALLIALAILCAVGPHIPSGE